MSKVAKGNGKTGAETRVTDMGITEETVTFTLTVPRNVNVTLLKETGASVVRDLATLIEHPNALKHLLSYGIGRFNRDGASPGKYIDGNGDFTDEKTARVATPEERKLEALRASNAKWDALLAGTLRQRNGGSNAEGMLVTECRTLTIRALVKRNVARKEIPKLSSLRVMEECCEPWKAEDLWTKIVGAAQKVVAARASNDI